MIWRSPALYSSVGFLYTCKHSKYEQKIVLAYWYNNQRANHIMHIYIRVYIIVSKISPFSADCMRYRNKFIFQITVCLPIRATAGQPNCLSVGRYLSVGQSLYPSVCASVRPNCSVTGQKYYKRSVEIFDIVLREIIILREN